MANNTLITNDGSYGTETVGEIGPLVQGQNDVVMLFTLNNLSTSAVNITGYTVSGKLAQRQDDNTYITAVLTGTTTVTDNANVGEFSWTTSAADVGENGNYIIWFTLTKGSSPTYITLPLSLAIIDDPDATGSFTANLVGVTAAERGWLTAALATGNALSDYARTADLPGDIGLSVTAEQISGVLTEFTITFDDSLPYTMFFAYWSSVEGGNPGPDSPNQGFSGAAGFAFFSYLDVEEFTMVFACESGAVITWGNNTDLTLWWNIYPFAGSASDSAQATFTAPPPP